MFHLSPNMDIGGTFLIGHITLAPGKVMRAFGIPQDGDGHKVSGEYAFSGPKNTRFTLYDWKYGYNVWDRKSLTGLQLNIGGDDTSMQYLRDFVSWLRMRSG